MRTIADRYQLLRLLGEGGVSQVYLAWDRVLNVERALKILRTDAPPHWWQRRFLAEAQAMARLNHPAILRVYDYGVEGERAWLVIEYAPGGSLADRLAAQGPLPLPDAIRYTVAILGGLEVAHQARIVHRDIKPANILLGDGDRPMLADFGIARLPDAAHRHTQVGAIMGTMAFMAPEQRMDSSAVGTTADLYALGATLYLLVTGNTPVDLCYSAPTSPRWDIVSSALCPTLQRALHLEPDQRFPDAASMRQALTAVQTRHTEAPDAPSDRDLTRRRHLEETAAALRAARSTMVPESAPDPALLAITRDLNALGVAWKAPTLTAAATAVESADADHLLPTVDALLEAISEVSATPSPTLDAPDDTDGTMGGERGPRQRILLVEDDAEIAELIQWLPWPDDTEVTYFHSGSALLADPDPPAASIILMDVQMPGLSGLETLTQLRERALYASTPVVMLTSVGDEATVVEAFALGADDYVEKPFSPARLSARINRLLARVGPLDAH